MSGPFAGLSLGELAQRLRDGSTRAEETALTALAAAEELGGPLGCFTALDSDGALRDARRADRERARGVDRGPLHGVPVAVKDVIAVAGLPLTMGSRHFEHHVAARDADVVTSLRQAGAVLLGKTVTHEFAYGPTADRSLHGPARNPHDPDRMAGGSSGGSGSAVAAGIVPVALGTDTGGSVRIPAALCGIAGLRPSTGALSAQGLFPLSGTLDTAGPMTRSAADLALVWQALTARGADRRSLPRPGLEQLRFGTVVADLTRRVTDEQAEALDASCRALATAGANVAPVPLPEVDECPRPYVAIQSAEAYALHRRRVESAPELFDAEVLDRLRAASLVTGWEYVEALEERRRLRGAVRTRMAGLDFLLLPTVPVTAPRVGSRGEPLGAGWDNPREALLALTSPWSVLGLPAVSVPVPRSGGGLPVAVQVVARHGEDDLLLHAAELLERSLRGQEG